MSSSEPKVTLLSVSVRPFEDAVSSARTCYSSKGIVLPADVSEGLAEAETRQRYSDIISSIYQAGHHTTLQHSYLHFAIENTSRLAIWSFLHSHSFYNSEQVSQRYVKVQKNQIYVPQGLNSEQMSCLNACYELQISAYNRLVKSLHSITESEYLKRFRSRRGSKRAARDIQKKCQEIARYVLPLGTTAYLHHTISFLSLMRYIRICQMPDAPYEQKQLAQAMLQAVRAQDPQVDSLVEPPLEENGLAELQFLARFGQSDSQAARFVSEFDNSLDGLVSRLVDYKVNQVRVLADSIREVAGLPSGVATTDGELIDWVLGSAHNPYHKESLNLSNHSKLMRPLMHAGYTFKKKLSHAADSQDQRHRMTPGSRPILSTHFTGTPDYITPLLIAQDSQLQKDYEEVHARIWDQVNRGLALGMSFEQASYMLPNSLSVRFSESADMMALMHKMNMRLCYNAQEEIWQASLEEANQIHSVHPELGKHLLPPCSVRALAAQRPICPEGERFCGVPVWKLARKDYVRTI